MEYKIELFDDVVVLYLSGKLLGEHQTEDLSKEFNKLLDGSIKNAIIDMSELKFINSTGLNFLLSVLNKCRKMNGEVVLNRLNEQLLKLLIISKLNSFFIITNELEEAHAHFSTKNALPE